MSKQNQRWPLDLEALLAPISAAQPAGESLRYDNLYDRIKDARREDDPTLPQGVWATELKRADWDTVAQLCHEALMTRTKDLQIATWLLEAWLHLHGLHGVATGMHLLTSLCDAFWTTLHPALDGEHDEARGAPLRWLNEKLTLKLKQIPVTQPRTQDGLSYTWIDRENALHLENLAQKNVELLRQTENSDSVTHAQFRESVMLTPSAFYVDLNTQVKAAIDATHAFRASLTATWGDNAPSLARFEALLLEIHRMTDKILTERNSGEFSGGDLNGSAPNGGEVQPSTVGDAPLDLGYKTIHSRDEAYQMLTQIAEYLMKVEPHSPAPYLIKRAVSWGSMSLMELLLELVQNPGDQHSIFALLGIKEGGAIEE